MIDNLSSALYRLPSPRNRRSLYLCLACAILVLLLAGCLRRPQPPTPTVAPSPQPAPGQTGTPLATTPVRSPTATPAPAEGALILWHSWTGAEAEALARMLSSFRLDNPGIDIETLFVSDSRLLQAYADAVYAGGGPDVLLAPNWRLQAWVDAKTLLPLDDLVPAEVLAPFLPAALENMRYEGRLYGLPINFDLVSLYYNRYLIEPDQLPATTAEMLALAQGDPRHGAGLYTAFYHLYWGIPAYGSTLFDADGRVILGEGGGTAAFLAWLLEMSKTEGVFVDLDYGMLIDRFKKGEYAFFVDGPWSLAELEASLGDALAVTALPAGPAGPARPWLSADGVFLNPVYSRQQQALALRLALHLINAESATFLLESSRIPARTDVTIADPLRAAFLDQAKTAVASPHRPELVQVWGYAGDMVAKVLNEILTPQAAVAEAETLINEANDK